MASTPRSTRPASPRRSGPRSSPTTRSSPRPPAASRTPPRTRPTSRPTSSTSSGCSTPAAASAGAPPRRAARGEPATRPPSPAEGRGPDAGGGCGGFGAWRQEREADLDRWLDEHMKSERVACRLTTISAVIREHGLERIDLLKLDAERSELDALAGIAEEDWPKIRQMVIEVHDERIRDRVLEVLAARGYETVVEQDVYLEETELYNVYARRPGVERTREGRQAEGGW